jgi:hypothetical protein
VTRNIRECLLHDAEYRGRPFRVQFDSRRTNGDLTFDSGPFLKRRHLNLDGRGETKLGEQWRPQFVRDAPNTLHRSIKKCHYTLDASDAFRPGDAVQQRRELELRRGQQLTELVVELPCDAGALLLLNRYDPAGDCREPFRATDQICLRFRNPRVVEG